MVQCLILVVFPNFVYERWKHVKINRKTLLIEMSLRSIDCLWRQITARRISRKTQNNWKQCSYHFLFHFKYQYILKLIQLYMFSLSSHPFNFELPRLLRPFPMEDSPFLILNSIDLKFYMKIFTRISSCWCEYSYICKFIHMKKI